jgi:hypothetical protein
MIINRYVISKNDTNDLLEAWGSKDKALLAAIVECTNRARLYIVPCSWAARFLANGEIVVTRKHSAPKGK